VSLRRVIPAVALVGLLFGAAGASGSGGAWLTVTSMTTARVWQSATPLVDGRILVVGGENSSQQLSNTAEVFDPATNAWTPTGPMAHARMQLNVALLNDGRVIAVGGDGSCAVGGTAELYDASTNSWSLTASMNVARFLPALAKLDDGRVLVVGGGPSCSAGPAYASTELFDPGSATWTLASPMTTPRQFPLAVVLQSGRVLVMGGLTSGSYLKSAEIYDPGSDSWSPAATMPALHYAGTATVLNDGRVLVVGGYGSDTSNMAGADIYDPSTDSWISAGLMQVSRLLQTATLLSNGEVLVTGGLGPGFGTTSSSELFDPQTSTWSAVPNMSVARYAHTATLLANGTVLVAGGQSTPEISASAETFSPPPPPDFVTRSGTGLRLNTQPYRPIGLNIYNANSNGWCWYPMDGTVLDDSLTAIGSGKNAMRAWFFQQLATTNGVRDWTAFDRTLATARAHGYKVIATLVDQWGNCGATNGQGYGYKDQTWYQSGYKQPDPSAIVSYRAWAQEVASRYQNNSTILAWQLVNEPEALVPPCHQLADGSWSCAGCDQPTAESSLESFASDVSTLIKLADPNHLVSLGTIGSGQCGASYLDFQKLMSVPTLDLCEYHDYTPNQLIPGDVYNGLQIRIDQCNALDKPLLVGELGVKPSSVGGTFADRARMVASKLCAQLSRGVAGELLWAWDKNGSLLDNFDIGPSDPVLDALSPWSDPSHSCSAPAAPSGVIAAGGDGSAAVSWLAPTSDGGSPVTSYTITSSTGGGTKTVGGSTTSTTLTGLANGAATTFAVTATNAAGTSAASPPSSAVTPQAGSPPPAAATGSASTTAPTTVATGSDPALTGGTTSSVTVPADTAGGTVSITQSRTSELAPTGYLLGGVQIDISAPAGTATNPLALVFTVAPAQGQPLDQTTLGSTEIYRAEGSGSPTLVPDCAGSVGQAQPDPCISNRQYVVINGKTYVQLTALTSSASRWNSATPKPGAVAVSDGGYSPQNLTVQPGANVTWSFAGKKTHSATDAVGLGPSATPWFDSSAKSSGTYGFTFPAAGTFAYKSTVKGDAMTGAVLVPVLATPASGRTTATFSVIWSTRTLSGYVFDVQYRFRPAGTQGWKNWTSWKTGLATTSATFVPSQGPGTYAFHARLRNSATGKSSGYSPDGTIAVS
jgi:mannan endo-1,4-beta-mannosidase